MADLASTDLTRRDFLLGAAGGTALLASGLLLPACGSSSSSTTSSTSTAPPASLELLLAGTGSIDYACEFVADAGGFFKKQNLDVATHNLRNSPQVLQQVVAGGLIVGQLESLNQVEAAANRGAPVVAIGVVFQRSPFLCASSSAHPLRTMAELGGRTVGLPTLGGGAEEVLNVTLKLAGVDPGTVRRVAAGSAPAALGFVKDGRTDAVFVTVEQVVEARRKGEDVYAFNVSGVNPVLGKAYVVTRDTLARHSSTLARFLKAVQGAALSIINDAKLDHTLSLLQRYELPVLSDTEAAKETLRTISQGWTAAGRENLMRVVPKLWVSGVTQLKSAGVLDGRTDATTLFATGPGKEAFG